MLVQVLLAPLLFQLPANGFGQTVGDGSSAIQVRNLDKVLGPWLWPVLALAIAAMWEVNQHVEDLCLFLSMCLTFK